MNLLEANALWDRVANDYRRDYWAGARAAALSPQSPIALTYWQQSFIPREPVAPLPTDLKIYGVPIRIDPTLPANELHIEGADGALLRIVHIGEGT